MRADVAARAPMSTPELSPATAKGTWDASSVATRPRPLLTSALLFFADTVSLSLAVALASWLWLFVNPNVDPFLFLALWPVLGGFIAGYAFMGLYPATGINPVEELRRLATGTAGVYLIVVLKHFLVGGLDAHSRGIYVGAFLLTIALVPLGRALIRHVLAGKSWWGVPVVVLGAGRTAELLIKRLAANPALGLKVRACLDDNPSRHGWLAGVPVLGTLPEAPRVARELRIRHALIAMPGVRPARLNAIVRRYAARFRHVFIIPDLFGTTSLGVSARDLAGVVGLHSRQNLLVPFNRILKRAMDFVLLVPCLVVALPIIGLAALWIRVVSSGLPFYAQEREGYLGKPIRVWKLRTMYQEADRILVEHFEANPAAREEWELYYKLKHDPRILPGVGELLRRTSLDELPQLWNVLRGEMSLIGPRPFPYYHLERFDEEFRDLRRQVLPGITGMWQVTARSDGDLQVQEELDSYYIRNWCIWFDLYLLARTPWAVLFGKGAY